MTKSDIKELDQLALSFLNNRNTIKKTTFIDPTMDYEEFETRCNALVTKLSLTYSNTMNKWQQLNKLFAGYSQKIARVAEEKSVDDILASI